MECPVCAGRNTKVVDSRDSRDGVRRRRVCNECGHRFTTRERIDETLPMVLKRTGERQPFDRSKIRRGLDIACRKRGVASEALDRIVAQIETWACTKGDREVESEAIGDRIMHHLYVLDQVAYVRFVSVYRSFESIEEFEHLLREMQKAERVDIEGQRTLFPDVFDDDDDDAVRAPVRGFDPAQARKRPAVVTETSAHDREPGEPGKPGKPVKPVIASGGE